MTKYKTLKLTKKQLQNLNGVLNYYINENARPEDMEEEMNKSGELKRLKGVRSKVQKLI